MYLLVIFLPFINFLILSLLGRFLNNLNSFRITFLNLFLTFLIVLFIFYEVTLNNTVCFINLFNWLIVNELIVNWSFLFDNLTATMLIIITFISLLVHIYSYEYMETDPHLNRFISYLSLFTFFMLILVTSSNFLQMFLGWEGVGLASYLLINFWYTRIAANKSALKAVILNRVGDLSLFIAFSIIIYTYKTLDYNLLYLIINKELILNGYSNINNSDIISIFLLIGAVGKSAQIGLHIWLPDAMEGPTPVSALIHAATMVTAGVFLLIRSSFIIENGLYIYNIIAIIGGLTAFFAATIGLTQNDIKRIIAYSTCSQLGYMVFACGLHHYDVGFFHLFNHAFFKALLFLSAGAIIHSLNNEQDIRKMGGVFKLLPLSYISFLIGSLTLSGFPFLTGYFSKDLIIELTYTSYNNYNLFIYWLGFTAAFCTAFYSFRLIVIVFFFKTHTNKKNIENIHENKIKINFTLILLIFCSIFIGFLFKDLIVGIGSNFWNNILYINPKTNNIFDAEFALLPAFKLLPTFISLSGIFLAILLYNTRNNEDILYKICINYKIARLIYIFLNKRWLFDIIYNFFLGKTFLKKSLSVFFKTMDRGFLEIIGPLGLTRQTYNLSIFIKFMQKGSLNIYLNFFAIFSLCFFFINIDSLLFILYILNFNKIKLTNSSS